MHSFSNLLDLLNEDEFVYSSNGKSTFFGNPSGIFPVILFGVGISNFVITIRDVLPASWDLYHFFGAAG